MKPKSFMELITPEVIQSFARKNYNTYVAHCEAKKLKPMVFKEFLKNYAILLLLLFSIHASPFLYYISKFS